MKKSDSISSLMKDLVQARAKIGAIKKSAKNPHFRSDYAPIDEIITAIQPALTGHGLHLMNDVRSENAGEIIVSAALYHVSGEWMETEGVRIKLGKDDAQGVGSAITYGRRYTVKSILGLADEDDDGNAASKSDKSPINTAIQKQKGDISAAKKMIAMAKTSTDCAEIEKKLDLRAWTDAEYAELIDTLNAARVKFQEAGR